MQRRFERGLLIGCPDPDWPTRLREFVNDVEVRDPGRLFAEAAAGDTIVEDGWTPASGDYDLILAIGTLDTVNDLPRAFRSVFRSLRPGSLFLGAVSGGDTLPQLRSAMRAWVVGTGSGGVSVTGASVSKWPITSATSSWWVRFPAAVTTRLEGV